VFSSPAPSPYRALDSDLAPLFSPAFLAELSFDAARSYDTLSRLHRDFPSILREISEFPASERTSNVLSFFAPVILAPPFTLHLMCHGIVLSDWAFFAACSLQGFCFAATLSSFSPPFNRRPHLFLNLLFSSLDAEKCSRLPPLFRIILSCRRPDLQSHLVYFFSLSVFHES